MKKTIIIPNTVTTVQNAIFAGSDNLTDIYYQGTESRWNEIFKNNYLPDGATVHFNN